MHYFWIYYILNSRIITFIHTFIFLISFAYTLYEIWDPTVQSTH